MMIEVVVDGVIFETQMHGGISRIYSEILPKMCILENSLLITLLTSGKVCQSLPYHPQILSMTVPPLEDLWRPGRFFWQTRQQTKAFVQSLWVGSSLGKVWHSSYYSLPYRWQGPIVVSVFDMIHEHFPDQFTGAYADHFRKQKQRCISTADAVVCISNTTKNDVEKICNVSSNKLYTVPLAASPVFRVLESINASTLPTDKPFILYVGGRSRYKNFDQILRSYARWNHRGDVDFVVVGTDWSYVELQSLVQYGLKNHVHLIKNADDEYLCTLYNLAVAFVYPSLYEGFGIPLLEAMACGCPIVASRIPSTIEISRNYPFFFELDDDDSLCVALDHVLFEGRSIERTRLGLERLACYSWDETARKTLELYYQLVRHLR